MNPEAPLPYFAYGSNMLLTRLRQANRCPSAQPLGPALLEGYELSFSKRSNVDGSGKCAIRPTDDPDSIVFGVLYRIEDGERDALDVVEGVGLGYDVVEVDVQPLDTDGYASRGYTAAFAYQVQPDWTTEGLPPMAWYRDLVLAGAIENHLPDGFIEWLRAHPVQEDPDRERSARERGALPEGVG